MTHDPTADPHAWWHSLPQEKRDLMHRAAQRSILQLPSYPFDSSELAAELLAWSQLENDVLAMHHAWLSATKAKFERNGWPWTTDELARRSRLWEVE